MNKRKEEAYYSGIKRKDYGPFCMPPHGRDADFEYIRTHNRNFRSDYNSLMTEMNKNKKDNRKKQETLTTSNKKFSY